MHSKANTVIPQPLNNFLFLFVFSKENQLFSLLSVYNIIMKLTWAAKFVKLWLYKRINMFRRLHFSDNVTVHFVHV